MEMTKRGVPGVWTYGFYDGWVPNYMFFIAHAHNSIGRFYEVMGYGPENRAVHGGGDDDEPRVVPSEPAAADDQVGAAQQHQHPAVGDPDRAQPRRARTGRRISRTTGSRTSARSNKGKTGPTYGWVIPATQKRKADAADAVNELRAQGLEVHTATAAFKAGQRRRQGRRLHRSAATSRTARSPTCTSRSRTTRRPIRIRTTTPAGRSSTCATW